MKFDVIIGNPPYQLSGDGHGVSGSTIYNLFVEQAKRLEPRFLTMVTPSRWMAGGLGLSDFRKAMLSEKHLRVMVDYPNSAEVFPGVDLKGGVCYFLWDREHDGDCQVTLIRDRDIAGPSLRQLDEHDVFIRDERAAPILEKVLRKEEPKLVDLVTGDTPFGLASNFTSYVQKHKKGYARLYMRGGDPDRWIDPGLVTRNHHLLDTWKVLTPEAGPGNSGGHVIPDMVLGRPLIAEPESACTQTYLAIGPFESQAECESVASYLQTRFLRFLVSLRKITQHALRSTYAWVPQQTWDREWTDEELYANYGITDDEIEFIESMIRPMEAAEAPKPSASPAARHRTPLPARKVGVNVEKGGSGHEKTPPTREGRRRKKPNKHGLDCGGGTGI